MAMSAQAVLKWAMDIETNGKTFYDALAAQATDADVKTLFLDLAYQEERHRVTFERLLERVAARAASSPTVDADERAQMQRMLSNALMGGEESGITLARQAKDETSAIQAAMAFEKDTLLLFYDLRELVPEGQQAAVTSVINEEKSHLRQLARLLEQSPWVA